MSALSISPVAASGSNAQASVQPGAPPDAADNSPFAILLAAITAADLDLQTVAQPGVGQTAQASPAIDAQPLTLPGAANDDDADAAIADGAADPVANVVEPSSSDPSQVAAPKSGGKPDKKANTDKSDTDAAANSQPMPAQTVAMPQPPIPLMAQAAVQTQTVVSDDDSDISMVGIGAGGTIPGSRPAVPDPNASQPILSQPPQADLKQAPSIAQPFITANDDSADEIDTQNIAATQIQPADVTATKVTQVRNPGGRAASQAAPQPQTAALTDDDADQGIEATAGAAAANTSSQVNVLASQIGTENAAPVSKPQQAQQKPDTSVAAPPPSTITASAADPAPSLVPTASVTTDDSGDSKPAHAIAAAAPPAQTNAPQAAPHAVTDAMPQATVAINVGGANAQGGLTLSVHVANHASDAQASASPAMTPDTDALAISVAARSLSGAKQFDIRLDPPELGRVDVRLSIDASGKTQAHMTTDQPRTLELLQKDAPNLTRALRDAGLDVSQSGLNFSLKGQNQGGQNAHFGAPSRALSLPAIAQSIEAAQSASTLPSLLGDARLDIHV